MGRWIEGAGLLSCELLVQRVLHVRGRVRIRDDGVLRLPEREPQWKRTHRLPFRVS